MAAALVTVLVVAFGVAGAIGLRSRRAAPLPVAMERLPRPTRFVARTDLVGAVADAQRMREADVPEQALWTALAERACGGFDMHRLLVEADRAPRSAALALAQPLAAQAKAIACGRALVDRGGPHRGLYRLDFDDDGHEIQVELMADGTGELPETVPQFRDTPAPGNLVAARCLVDWASDRDAACDGRSRALGRLGEDDAWAIGGLDELRAFGRAYALDVERDEAAFDAFEELAEEMASLPRSTAGLALGFTNLLTVVLDLDVSMHGEPETRALVSAVRDGALAWGMQRPPPDAAGAVRVVVVAKTEAEGAAIAAGWEAYLERLRNELRAREASPDASSGDDALAVARVRAQIARRAIDGAEVVVAGRRVELTAERIVDDAARATLATHHAQAAARAALAAEAIDALVRGALPSDRLVVELGGEAFLRALEVERAVVAGEWPFEPEAWPEVSGFFVPGRGRYGTEYLDTAEVFVYSYPMPRSVLRRVFADVARAKGWQVRRGATANLYELSRGDRRVRVLLGGRSPQTSSTHPSRTFHEGVAPPSPDEARSDDHGPTSSLVLFEQ